MVYDTTRPSGPLKTIPMNDATTGDIVSVACSPFSKTLVAVASAGGSVGLVDLDKDKAYVRLRHVLSNDHTDILVGSFAPSASKYR